MHNIVRKYALNVAIFNILLEATVEQVLQDPQVKQLIEARKTLEELTDRLKRLQDGQQ